MIEIRRLQTSHLPLFDAHFARHRAESGRGDVHFMPFEPNDSDGPKGLSAAQLALPLFAPGWQRWWVAGSDQAIVGHVDLQGPDLKTQLHRCELGIGIERAGRGQGLGRRLMEAAIGYAREEPTLHWVDLRVFRHNRRARELYRSLGFQEIGVLEDCFRIEGSRIDDVIMTLQVAS